MDIDQIITAAAEAETRAADSRLSTAWHLWDRLGRDDTLGVDAEQWGRLVGLAEVALTGARSWLEFPYPAGIVAAAAMTGVPGEDVQALIEDIDADLYRMREALHQASVRAAYERAGHLVESLRGVLDVVTTLSPAPGPDVYRPRPGLAAAVDRYRLAETDVERAREDLYEAVRAARAGGMSQPEITRTTGLSKPRVYQIFGGAK